MADWVRGLKLVNKDTLNWYQIPVVGGVPPFIDGIIRGGMKKSVTKNVLHRLVPYFGNKAPIIKAVNSGNETLEDVVTPFIVIIDQNQIVTFNIQATATTENIQMVTKKIQEFESN